MYTLRLKSLICLLFPIGSDKIALISFIGNVSFSILTFSIVNLSNISHIYLECLYASIDLVVEKLERQIRKNKTRIKERKVKDIPVINFEAIIEEEPKTTIVKRKSVEMKPMDEEEAVLQMELLGHEFFVFQDIDTDSISVLYKRKDGNYGIIETK